MITSGLNHLAHQVLPGEQGKVDKEKKNSNEIKQGAKVGKEIGASAEFIAAMDKSLKGNSKILAKVGKVGGFLSSGGQIIYDGVEYFNGEISGYRFSFRTSTTVVSAVIGAEIGTAIGGPAGFVAGTSLGLTASVAESAWDVFWRDFNRGFSGFINSTTNSWMRYQ